MYIFVYCIMWTTPMHITYVGDSGYLILIWLMVCGMKMAAYLDRWRILPHAYNR